MHGDSECLSRMCTDLMVYNDPRVCWKMYQKCGHLPVHQHRRHWNGPRNMIKVYGHVSLEEGLDVYYGTRSSVVTMSLSLTPLAGLRHTQPLNPKPQTLNPKPQTLNPTLGSHQTGARTHPAESRGPMLPNAWGDVRAKMALRMCIP